MKTSLEHKTVRPGSLSNFSFYYSSRRPEQTPATTAVAKPRPRLALKKMLLVVLLVGVGFVASQHLGSLIRPSGGHNDNAPAIAAIGSTTNACAGNVLDKFIKVSVSQRHLWACQGSRVVYNTPVITGMEKYASTETPLGTYKIYAKQQNTTLTGSDQTGSWRDPVSYWMPFLDNQYGTYGFHDATWRNPNEFGKVDPNSDKASHGCVELPLGASKWLYNWAQVGAVLTVES